VNLVLDTNVLVAALLARGVCGDLLEHCVRSHTVVSSSVLLDELREVLTSLHQIAVAPFLWSLCSLWLNRR
jgi:predicted nucleic acid-binding protein